MVPTTRFCLLISALVLLLPTIAPAMDSSIHFGRIPLLPGGKGIEIAVPLEVSLQHATLEYSGDALRLQAAPGEPHRSWLVLSPTKIGGVSALLTVQDSHGERRNLAVSGEVVAATPEDMPQLLLRGNRHASELTRYMRPVGMERLVSQESTLKIGTPDDEGWQRVDLAPLRGHTEASARASLGEHAIQVRASLLESITVRAAALLAPGFEVSDLRTLDESLDRGILRARLGLLGRRQGTRYIRWFDVRADGTEGSAYVRAGRDYELGRAQNEVGGRLLSLEPAYIAGFPAPPSLMLSLRGQFARLIDPDLGILQRRRAVGLRFLGIAARGQLRSGEAWALRRNLQTGGTHLRRWSVVQIAGEFHLRGVRVEEPLEDLFQVRGLRARALRSRVHREAWPQAPMVEEMLLAVQLRANNKADPPLEIRGLRLRRDAVPTIVGARRLFRSQLRPLPGDSFELRLTPSPIAGSKGYPRIATLNYGGLIRSEVIGVRGVGSSYEGIYQIPARSHRFQTANYPSRFALQLHADSDGKDTFLRLRSVEPELVLRAQGLLRRALPLRLRASVRGRHAYALTSTSEGRRRLRLLDVGRATADLPPVVLLDGRMRVLPTSPAKVELRLRGRALDANGDPLGLRWSGPGVRFDQPNSAVTRARFPVGVSRVRLRARERGEPQPDYEGWDVRYVWVGESTGVPTPGLRTELRGVFPNPANPRASIAYTVGTPGRVRLHLYDAAGRKVKLLRDTTQGRGAYDVVWDGRDDAGREVASGVYHVHLESEGTVDTDRVVLVR